MFLFHKNQTKREAFGQMFTEMYPRMVRYASQLMGDGEEARDIVSEVMEQAWKHFDQWTRPTAEAGFIQQSATPASTG